MALGAIFLANRNLWKVLPLPEQRVQTSADHFRMPDLCIVRRGDPADAIVHAAPLLGIEILSREDTLQEMQERVDDYAAMGVANIWVIDPVRRIAYLGGEAGFMRPPNDTLAVPNTPILISLVDLFSQVDDLNAGR